MRFRNLKYLIAFIIILLCTDIAIAEEWAELKGTHFLVYFINRSRDDEKFAKDVLDRAEVYYKNIALDLGYPRYSEFWLWDNRVKIYIYPNKASYLKATGEPGWTEGKADYQLKAIISYQWSKGFTESLLPHEIGHLIFRDFIGFKSKVPLWLDEGVAQWAEESKRKEYKAMIVHLWNKDSLLLLDDITNFDIKKFTEKDRVYIRESRNKKGEPIVLFLDINTLINIYYLEGVALVGFLIEKYGSARFAEFCRQLRDGSKLEDALRGAYPVQLHNLRELEDRWLEYIEEELVAEVGGKGKGLSTYKRREHD